MIPYEIKVANQSIKRLFWIVQVAQCNHKNS